MRLSRSSRISLRIVVAIVLAFIYIPLIVIFIYAFNSSNLLEWPPPGLTLHWFPEALKNTDARDAFVTSLKVGAAATAVALFLGTLASLGNSNVAMCQGFSRTVGRCATSSTSTMSPPPTSRRSTRPRPVSRPRMSARVRPISILEVAKELCEARGEASPVVTGQYRSGDVRHIVASPAGAVKLLGYRAVIDPRDGLREFAYAPLRG